MFWDDLEKMLATNPVVGASDTAMADQARTMISLRKSDPNWKSLLDKAALEADAALHTSAKYEQVGVDAGNGWQRQENAGVWGSDWFGRAQAAVIYMSEQPNKRTFPREMFCSFGLVVRPSWLVAV